MTAHTMRMPDLGEGVVEVELVTWLVAVGDTVTPETSIAEVMTDKASVEISAPAAGRVTEILVAPGAIVAVGTEIVRIDGDTTPAAPPARADLTEPKEPEAVASAPSLQPAAPMVPGVPGAPRPIAAPSVRHRARQLGIALTDVNGTGPNGRITDADLEAAASGIRSDGPRRRRDDIDRTISGVRRVIAERLTRAWEAPHITYVEEIDVTEIERLRQTLNAERPDADRLTLLPLIARSVMVAVDDHPVMNASFDAEHGVLHEWGSVHLGIATQTERGLVVPVVRHADEMSLHQLSDAIRSVAGAARAGTADRQQLTGSTITISSLGALGGIANTPLLNAPEVAIVGVNRQRLELRWTGTAFEPATVMNISASFDHRIVDGYAAAEFVQRIRALLETPALLTLGWDR